MNRVTIYFTSRIIYLFVFLIFLFRGELTGLGFFLTGFRRFFRRFDYQQYDDTDQGNGGNDDEYDCHDVVFDPVNFTVISIGFTRNVYDFIGVYDIGRIVIHILAGNYVIARILRSKGEAALSPFITVIVRIPTFIVLVGRSVGIPGLDFGKRRFAADSGILLL